MFTRFYMWLFKVKFNNYLLGKFMYDDRQEEYVTWATGNTGYYPLPTKKKELSKRDIKAIVSSLSGTINFPSKITNRFKLTIPFKSLFYIVVIYPNYSAKVYRRTSADVDGPYINEMSVVYNYSQILSR